MEREVRTLSTAGLECRASDSARTIRGYAAKFETLSENLGGFREKISPGAFDDVLGDDVRALINHDPNLIIGRTASKTARIGVDDVGLWYEVDLPDTSAARDLSESINRGDVSQSSFAFTVAAGGQDWTEDDEGRVIRTISKMQRLYDVSPVTYPAYPDATVGVRALDQYREQKTEEQRKRDAEEASRRVRQKRAHQARLERLKTPSV